MAYAFFNITSMKLQFSWLLDRVAQGKLKFYHPFEKPESVWTRPQRSLFIESCLLGLPMPPIWLIKNLKNEFVFIDGVQRSRAIIDYIQGQDRLIALEFLGDIKGATFRALPAAYKKRLLATSFDLHYLEPGAPAQLKKSLFDRVNYNGR